MNQNFTKYAEQGAYHWERTYRHGWMQQSPRLHARYDVPLRLLRRRVRLDKAKGIDLGCGDGVLVYKILRNGGHIVGLDYSEEGLRCAQVELSERGFDASKLLLQGSCYEVPVKNEEFDYAIAVELIEHLEDVPALLREVERILKPGGWFICTTPNRKQGQSADEVQDPFHVREFVADELKASLSRTFPETSVYGAYPSWLDRLYVDGLGNPYVRKGIRLLFRAASRTVANPYVYALKQNPNHSRDLLVGVAQKGEKRVAN